MNQILTLREKRAKAWDAAKAFLDEKRGTDGMLSAEDAATYDKMETDVVSLGHEIERLERQATLDLEFSQPTRNPLTDKPGASVDKGKTGRASDEYRRSFWNMMRSKNPSFEVMNALQVGVDSEGGVFAPDEFERTLIEALEEQNIFRGLAKFISTSSGDRKIPVVASKGSAAWIDEEAAYPESDDSFGMISIGAFKLATMIKVSEELLNDSVFDVASYIAKEFARRIGTKEEEAFFVGDGSGKPTGLLSNSGGAELGRDRHERHGDHAGRDHRPLLLAQVALPEERGLPHERHDGQGNPEAQRLYWQLHLAARRSLRERLTRS